MLNWCCLLVGRTSTPVQCLAHLSHRRQQARRRSPAHFRCEKDTYCINIKNFVLLQNWTYISRSTLWNKNSPTSIQEYQGTLPYMQHRSTWLWLGDWVLGSEHVTQLGHKNSILNTRKCATEIHPLYSDLPQVKWLQHTIVLDDCWSHSHQPSRPKTVVSDDRCVRSSQQK